MPYITQLRTTDLERSIAFYSKNLGFPVKFRYEDFYAGIDVDGQTLHIKLVDEVDPSIAFAVEGDHFHLYFEVSDLVIRHEELKARNLDVGSIVDQPWGQSFVLRDPDGHRIYYASAAA